MHSDWFNGIEILQGRWQHGGKVGYCYPSRLEKTLCKWDVYVLLVMKGLKRCTSWYGMVTTNSMKISSNITYSTGRYSRWNHWRSSKQTSRLP
jgi:hypothetical protein